MRVSETARQFDARAQERPQRINVHNFLSAHKRHVIRRSQTRHANVCVRISLRTHSHTHARMHARTHAHTPNILVLLSITRGPACAITSAHTRAHTFICVPPRKLLTVFYACARRMRVRACARGVSARGRACVRGNVCA